jgi:hypothetical protein
MWTEKRGVGLKVDVIESTVSNRGRFLFKLELLVPHDL